jgi:hypothetical protein
MARKPLGGIKITGPKPKALSLTPPSGTWKGIPILRSKRYLHHKFFFYHSLLICRLPCRVPQDIPLSSLARDTQPEGKPPSPSAEKTLPKTSNTLSSKGTDATSALTSKPAGDSRRHTTQQSPRPDPTMHQDASAISPKLFGLRAHGGSQSGEGSSMLRPRKQLRQYSRVAESL